MVTAALVNLDTSHVIAFTELFSKGTVAGVKVTHAFRGESNVRKPDEVEAYAVKLRDEFGVTLVDTLEELVPLVDCALIEANEGSRHLAQAKPFLEAGKRCWVDKPFAGSHQDARALAGLAYNHGTHVFSASALRFAADLTAFKAEHPQVAGADVITPSPLHWANPGLLHYGIHGVEMLYALLGPGCRAVSCFSTPDTEVCVGTWTDGRLGTLRGLHTGPHAYGFRAVVAGDKPGVFDVTVGLQELYLPMVRHVAHFLQTGESPVTTAESVETIAFMDAALESAKLNGQLTALSNP